jgi:nucleoside phosphorylase
MPCAVIITSLPVEYHAVREYLTDLREINSSDTFHDLYEMGQFLAWDVGLAEIGVGNMAAALGTERAIQYFKPQVILFVGVAGGIKDVVIGDVVAVTKIYGYESGKEVGGIFSPRPQMSSSSHGLVTRARAEALRGDWLGKIDTESTPRVFVGPIAAGEKVIASRTSPVYEFLRSHYSDAIAVEMGGLGFLEAVQGNLGVSAIVIRGISDLLDEKSMVDHADAQKIACRNASAFAFELLAKLNVEDYGLTKQRFQEIVAIDPNEDEGIDRPFDPAQIRIESRNISIDLLLKRIQHGELNLAPDFQRRAGIWKPAVQSRLIESLLIRIPLPAFYLDATNDEQWAVIDGLQRLSTLQSFILSKNMKLEGLEFLQQFNGCTYDELPRNLQRRIEETQVTVYLLNKGTPPEVKFNIFKRINTGGSPLSSQEIRHALNQGVATKILQQLAESTTFVEATGISADRMIDQELVLRFFAFMITAPRKYSSSNFDSFLNDTMVKINLMDREELDRLSRQFIYSVQCASNLFGSNAFRKPNPQQRLRNPINKSLFESWCVNLAQATHDESQLLEDRKHTLRQGFEVLMDIMEFKDAISQGTGSTKKIRTRFKGIKTLINHCLSDEYEDLEILRMRCSNLSSDDLSILPAATAL